MNVVPLRRYSYLEWITICGKTNALRSERLVALWGGDESHALWRALFE